jgi:hypothetical protein
MADNSITGAQEQTGDPVPAMSTVTPDDPDGTIGLCTVTGAVMRAAEIVRENGGTKKLLNWLQPTIVS